MAGVPSELSRRQQRQYITEGAAAEDALSSLPPEVVREIRTAWTESAAAPGDFAADLYAHLFALEPSAAMLFPGDISQQRQRLTRTLTEGLALLERPKELILLLKASGVRHLHYHTNFRHFPMLGAALDRTFSDRLGDGFTADRQQAWRSFYSHMAAVMCGSMATALLQRA